MYGLEYTLELLEPVLANGPAGDSNSAQSLRHIPGSLLRGAAIGEYLKEQPELDVSDEVGEVRRLFFSGATRYLHAYPIAGNGQRAVPAPLAWHKRKTPKSDESPQQRDLFDLSLVEQPEEQLTGLGDARFCVMASEQAASWVEFGEQVNVHTQRDAVAGRAKENSGAVFRYEALPAGLQLKGVIFTESAADATTLKTLLAGKTLRLGKSRSAGYGALKLTVNEELAGVWKEVAAFTNEETNATEYANKERHYAGRVCISEARLCAGQEKIWLAGDHSIIPRVLASPKPTTFQHYL